MFILRAPYPALQTTTLLPSPKFGDNTGLKATVTTMRSMNGTLYTYVQSREEGKKLRWDFELSRDKAKELREFINSYFDVQIHITDHDDVIWIGYLKNNPFEFEGGSRAGGWPGGETMTVTLEFEER